MHDPIPLERLQTARILVVDDAELNRKMLSHSLQAHGFKNILTANDGSQALQMTTDLRPDLVILDMMMPQMDGFSYCNVIRKDSSFNNMPVLVQTALDTMEQKLRAFKMGASDYLTKPVNADELIARTRVHLTQRFLVEDLRNYQQRISAELDSARVMQDRLMPGKQQIDMCERIYDMKIACHFETSSALGGDSWGMRPLSDKRLAIYMYDFSGHGMTAAMNVFRMHTIMQEFIHAGGDPGNFLSTINRHLHSLLARDEFATMFYGIIDNDANCLLYACAAVPSPMLFTKLQGEPVYLNGRGFPLGAVQNAVFETRYTPFIKGDLLLLYSDCLLETQNKAGEFFDERRIQDATRSALQENASNPAQHTVDMLMKRFREHAGSTPITDDITINAYARRG